MITIHDIAQGTPEWKALRGDKFTGSSAYKLLKFGAVEYSKTENTSFGGNFYTKRGHILEDEAISLYQLIAGEQVNRVGAVSNDLYPECLFSPDGLTDTHVIEVKCFNVDRHMAMFNSDIDFKVLAQIHFGMFITELKAAKLIIYNPDIDDPHKAFKAIDIDYVEKINNNFENKLLGK